MRCSPNEPSLLGRLGSPADLRRLPRERLPQLAAALRRHLNDCGANPAEATAPLATVELAIALHYCFRTPQDRLIWDGGQDTQAHQLLTGGRARVHAVRARSRSAAPLLRGDNKYDHFGVGHAGTAISAALGMANAAALRGESRRVVAVIGDRALAAGMAFEALNHAGSQDADLLVILNDSGESGGGGTDALSEHCARAFSGSLYGQLRAGGKRMLRQLPTMRELARRSEKHLKGMLLPGTLFEEIGFIYTGPLDGHDLKALVRALQSLQKQRGRQFLHILTNGRATRTRAPALVRSQRSSRASVTPRPAPMARGAGPEVLGRWLCDMAERDPRLVCVNAASAAGMSEFAARFAARYFDLATREQHAVTFAAGLATEGRRPVLAIGSSLLQRGYDQLVHDVALQRLPVLFALGDAGPGGGAGAAHQGSFDVSFLRCIPGLTLATPADENECRQLLYTAATLPGPAVVRLPGHTGGAVAKGAALQGWPAGRGEIRREGGSGLALLVFGAPLAAARQVAEHLDATLVNMRFVKPLDVALLQDLCARHEALVTIEENAVAGGAGSAVGEALAAQCLLVRLLHLGIPDHFVDYGTREARLAAAGLDAAGLTLSIERWSGAPRRRRHAALA
jgi:1-deoxy-D-xylulose-5-phosphate synthase